MEPITLQAHFDGASICLDEPYELAKNQRLIVTVASKRQVTNPQEDEDREYWLSLSRQVMQDGYAEDEPEYTLDMLREVNPDYAGG
jgi:hypothetical protein